MKLRDICTLTATSVNPQPDTHYHLYSLPSFDDNMRREELYGSDIHSNKYVVPDKCILFNKLNVRFKRVWRIDNSDTNKLASTEFLPLVVDESKVDYQYCYYLLISDGITNYLCGQNSNTSGSHKRIEPSDFLNIDIALPPMEVQKKVGKILADLDSKIILNKQINQNLEALAKQLYDYWFVQFDFPDENGKPYKSSGGEMEWNEQLKREIPKGWEVKTFADILGKVDSTPRLTTEEYLLSGKYPIIDQTTNVYFAGFTDRDDAVLSQYPAVVFGDHSCEVKYVNFPFARGADGTQIMLSKESRVSVEYLYFAAKGVKIGKGYARHYTFLKGSLLLLPEQTLADLFKEKVTLWFTSITNNRMENLSLIKQRDELLPLLMNGQVNFDLSAD